MSAEHVCSQTRRSRRSLRQRDSQPSSSPLDANNLRQSSSRGRTYNKNTVHNHSPNLIASEPLANASRGQLQQHAREGKRRNVEVCPATSDDLHICKRKMVLDRFPHHVRWHIRYLPYILLPTLYINLTTKTVLKDNEMPRFT